MIKKYWPLLALVGLAAFLIFKKKTASPIVQAVSNTNANNSALQLETIGGIPDLTYKGNADVNLYPPPGYSGPVGGPFKWAGIGNPPDGVWVSAGMTT